MLFGVCFFFYSVSSFFVLSLSLSLSVSPFSFLLFRWFFFFSSNTIYMLFLLCPVRFMLKQIMPIICIAKGTLRFFLFLSIWKWLCLVRYWLDSVPPPPSSLPRSLALHFVSSVYTTQISERFASRFLHSSLYRTVGGGVVVVAAFFLLIVCFSVPFHYYLRAILVRAFSIVNSLGCAL